MRIATLLAALLPLTLATPCWADSEAEREQLRKAQAELAQLHVRLMAAQAAADPDARIHFRYDWLRRDLEKIRRGIQAHIDAPEQALELGSTVRGDYRR